MLVVARNIQKHYKSIAQNAAIFGRDLGLQISYRIVAINSLQSIMSLSFIMDFYIGIG